MTQIFPVQITRTIEYHPKAYIEFCQESSDEPTQEGFFEFISEWIDEDFREQFGTQTVEILKNF